jgi:2-hydroxymuconate-semialdehyde hydrolase
METVAPVSADPEPNGAAPSGIARSDVTAAGRRLRILTAGDPGNPAVLWLHGSGPGAGARSNWEHLLPRMADRWFNVAPDVLGFGDSEHPDPAPQGMVAYTRARAESAVGLLDALGIEKAHLVGNSMGGMIALTTALMAPERVGRVVLMGSGGGPFPPGEDLLKLITFYDDPTVASMADLMQRFAYDPAVFGGRLEEIAADRLAQASRQDVRRSHLATFDPTGGPVRFTPEDLARLPHEVLVLHGREDRMLPLDHPYWLATHIPRAQLHVLPRSGHWIQIEQADRFVALTRLFLAEDAPA